MNHIIKQLENDILRMQKSMDEARAMVAKTRAEAATGEKPRRTVLLVGGHCDGMRIEQELPAPGRIQIPVGGIGMVTYGVQEVYCAGAKHYIASPDAIFDSMAQMIARYPHFVEPNK